MVKKIICYLLFILVFSASGFCAEPVKVAAIFSKTGEATAISIEHLVTVRMAVKEINTNGGILNRQIKLIELDNQSTAIGSRQAARKAIELKVAAVLGASWSSHALGMAKTLQKAGIPMLTPTSTNPKVTLTGDYIFRVCFIDSFQGDVLARFTYNDLKLKKAAVLTNVDQVYSIDLSSQFIESFTKLGGSISAELDYVENLSEYRDLIAKLLAHKFDVVMLPGYTRDSAQIIKTARNMDVNNIFIGGDGWSHLMINYARDELNGCFYLTHWHKELTDQKTIAFMEKVVDLFEWEKVNAGMALSYDMVYLLADAITRAKSVSPHKIRNALAQTKNFIGVTGPIRFDENRNPVKPAVILEFTNGKFRVVKQVNPSRSSF